MVSDEVLHRALHVRDVWRRFARLTSAHSAATLYTNYYHNMRHLYEPVVLITISISIVFAPRQLISSQCSISGSLGIYDVRFNVRN